MSIIEQLLSDMKKIQECGCAGGVTTGSFAPAVTNTVYPKPGKKKTKFRKKTEDLLKELTQQQLDDLYSDDDEDSSEQYWPDWSKANWDEYNKNKQQANAQLEKAKTDFINKYKDRNQKKSEILQQTIDQYSNDPEVNISALNQWAREVGRQIIRATVDCKRYENMSAEEFNKIEKHVMKPINTKIEYWRIRKYDPMLD